MAKTALTAAQKVERDAEICRQKVRGRAEKRIAESVGASLGTVRKVWSDFRLAEKPKVKGRDPLDLVWESISRYEGWIEQLAEIAATSETDHAAIAAINTQMTALAKRDRLLQDSGILPRDLGTLRIAHDVRFIVESVVKVFEEDNIPMESRRKILALMRESRN